MSELERWCEIYGHELSTLSSELGPKTLQIITTCGFCGFSETKIYKPAAPYSWGFF